MSNSASDEDGRSPLIVAMTLDHADSKASIYRSDGKMTTLRLQRSRASPTGAIARIHWVPGLSAALLVTAAGDEIAIELPRGMNAAPRLDRLVVYLDQNHWSAIANAISTPGKVGREDRDAAYHLIDMVRTRRILLPMSAGHVAETCRWTDDRSRSRLALAILELSAGWQMRDPLAVRRWELRSALVARFKPYRLIWPPVFTLESDAMYIGRKGDGYTPPNDIPEDLALAVQVMTFTAAVFETMLDHEPAELSAMDEWAAQLQSFTGWATREPADRLLRRRRSAAKFVADTKLEIAEEAHAAGITSDEMAEWLTIRSDEDIAGLPSLGLFREVFHDKLLDRGTKWERNDLTDMMYLTCAAGYADHVVGERRAMAHIEQAQRRLGRPVNVHRRLADVARVL